MYNRDSSRLGRFLRTQGYFDEKRDPALQTLMMPGDDIEEARRGIEGMKGTVASPQTELYNLSYG